MFKTLNRVRVIQTMNQYSLRLELLKENDPDDIMLLCDKLGERKTPLAWYADEAAIQKELISDDRFFFYLEKMKEAGIAKHAIGTFLKELHAKGELSVDYPVDRLLSSMALTAYRSNIFHGYLKYFSARPTSRTQKDAAVYNLDLYNRLAYKPVAELTEAEQLLFWEPCLADLHLDADSVGRLFSILTSPNGPLPILRFLNENGFAYRANISAYESMNLAAQDINTRLRVLHKMLEQNHMISLLRLWFENNCPLYDLEILSVKLKGMDDEKLQENLSTRSSYINLIRRQNQWDSII